MVSLPARRDLIFKKEVVLDFDLLNILKSVKEFDARNDKY